jgi:hypothetical protein
VGDGPVVRSRVGLLSALVYVAVAWAIDGRALLRATSLVPQADERPGQLA